MLFPRIYPVTCHSAHVGTGSVFVAVDGCATRGSSFIAQAIERGATTIVVERSYAIPPSLFGKAMFVFVDDARRALARKAASALGNPASRLKLVGITGTAGKTTTTFLLEHMLREAGYRTALLGSIRNSILDEVVTSDLTTPSSDYLHMFFHECVKQKVDVVIMEVSSHAIALHRTYGLTFDAVGFTNFSAEHLDFHKTMDDYFSTKRRLCSQVKKGGLLVLNADDARVAAIAPSFSYCSLIGQSNTACDYGFRVASNGFSGITITLDDTIVLSLPLVFGSFNAYNVVMAYAIGKKLGVRYGDLVRGCATFKGVPGRLQSHRLKNNAIAFVDFAHKSVSFEAVLRYFRSLTDHLIVLFGCGGDRDKQKRPVMGKLAAMYGDAIIITDDNPRLENRKEIIEQIYAGIPKGKQGVTVCLPDRKLAIKRAVELSRAGSVIAILGKGDESYYLYQGERYCFNDFEEIARY